jgi:hypothetical protein
VRTIAHLKLKIGAQKYVRALQKMKLQILRASIFSVRKCIRRNAREETQAPGASQVGPAVIWKYFPIVNHGRGLLLSRPWFIVIGSEAVSRAVPRARRHLCLKLSSVLLNRTI